MLGPCRMLGGDSLLKRNGGLVRHANLVGTGGDRAGRRRSCLSDNTLCRASRCGGGCGSNYFCWLGEGCFLTLTGRRWCGRICNRLRASRELLGDRFRRLRRGGTSEATGALVLLQRLRDRRDRLQD
jgi:hypothetical protein